MSEQHTRAIQEQIDALNRAIARAYRDGMNVELDMRWQRHIGRAQPLVSVSLLGSERLTLLERAMELLQPVLRRMRRP